MARPDTKPRQPRSARFWQPGIIACAAGLGRHLPAPQRFSRRPLLPLPIAQESTASCARPPSFLFSFLFLFAASFLPFVSFSPSFLCVFSRCLSPALTAPSKGRSYATPFHLRTPSRVARAGRRRHEPQCRSSTSYWWRPSPPKAAKAHRRRPRGRQLARRPNAPALAPGRAHLRARLRHRRRQQCRCWTHR